MKIGHYAAIAFLAAVTAGGLPFAANAQGASGMPQLQPTALNQYPSFVEITGTTAGGSTTQFDLRCGYSAAAATVSPDANMNDFSVLDSKTSAYSRYQNIDGKPVVTGPDPATPGGKRVIVQVIEPDGTVKAKNCALNMSNDTVSSCSPAKPQITAAQAKAEGDAVETQCKAFLGHAQINPSIYSSLKTQEYKQKLTSKLADLETAQ